HRQRGERIAHRTGSALGGQARLVARSGLALDKVLAEIENLAGIALFVRIGSLERHPGAFSAPPLGLVGFTIVARDDLLDRLEDFLDRGFAFVPHASPMAGMRVLTGPSAVRECPHPAAGCQRSAWIASPGRGRSTSPKCRCVSDRSWRSDRTMGQIPPTRGPALRHGPSRRAG